MRNEDNGTVLTFRPKRLVKNNKDFIAGGLGVHHQTPRKALRRLQGRNREAPGNAHNQAGKTFQEFSNFWWFYHQERIDGEPRHATAMSIG